MPRYIVHHDGWFLEWSTVVDAPYGYGARREQFEREYRHLHGDEAASALPKLIERALANGTSAPGRTLSAEALIERGIPGGNAAGYDETYLPLADVIRIYCVERRDPRKGEGVDRTDAA